MCRSTSVGCTTSTTSLRARAVRRVPRALRQVYIALAGSLDVVLYDGRTERRITLSRRIGPLPLPDLAACGDGESGSSLLVLASDAYDESDYIGIGPTTRSLATGSTTQ